MMSSEEIVVKIKELLSKDLPGQYFQNLMSPVVDDSQYRSIPKDHKVACVMALLHKKADDKLYISYIVRASNHPDDKHAGQIGFPGGKFEKEDKSLLSCALREVEEEIGIKGDQISVLGELTSIYVFASNFLVYPFLGFLEKEPQYINQVEEVDEVLEVPLSLLMDPKFKITKEIELRKEKFFGVPGYEVLGHLLWGATAMISSEIEEILRRSHI